MAFCGTRISMLVAGLLTFAAAGFGQLQTPTVQAGEQLDAVSIRITRFGPWPASVTHGSGPFLLYIANRSGVLVDTYSLVLKPASSSGTPAASLLDLHSTEARQRDHQFIQLLPGDYELHFQSHPDWVVSITITAN